MGLRLSFVLGIALTAGSAPAASGDTGITRVDPLAFRGVPLAARRTLLLHDCKVPQGVAAKGRVNIILGRFVDRGRKDVAALCSRSGRSSIMVVNADSGDVLAQMAEQRDDLFVQAAGGPGKLSFSRRLLRVPNRQLARGARAAGLPIPDSWREGISDAFVGKASTVYYRDKDKWHEMPGAD